MAGREPTANQVDHSRRAFLRGRTTRPEPPRRPPWVISEAVFLDGCTRCEACVEACPERIIVRGDGGFPEVDFSRGGCTFCRGCVEACPEPLFNDPDTHSPWSGLAEIQDGCLGYRGVLCQSCKDFCDAGAIRFDLAERRIPVPRVDPGQCTGCGFCYAACPVDAIEIKPGGSTAVPGE